MEKEIGNNKKMERVCEICEKVFSSGKALGGHMRSHLHTTTSFTKQHRRQENAAAAPRDCAAAGCGKCRCVICGKNFPSMKSLFGHMRCHPDRDWRGINPPPPPPPTPSSTGDNLTCSSSSASSSLSDVNNPPIIGFEDRMREKEREKAVDLTESLRGWAVTAKRGRKGTAAAEDDRLRDAVKFLMMLAEGKNMHKHNSCEGEEVVDIIHEERDSGVNIGGESDHVMTKLLLKKKKRKKVKQLCDLKLMENDSYNILDHNTKLIPATKGVMLDFDLNEEPPLELTS